MQAARVHLRISLAGKQQQQQQAVLTGKTWGLYCQEEQSKHMPAASACSGADGVLGRKLSRGGDVREPGVGNFFEDCPSNPGTE